MNNPHTVTGMWRHVLSIYHHMTQNDKDLQKTAQNTVESLDMNLWIVFIAFCCCCWSLLPLLSLVCNWHLSVITRRKYNVVSYNNESNWRRRVYSEGSTVGQGYTFHAVVAVSVCESCETLNVCWHAAVSSSFDDSPASVVMVSLCLWAKFQSHVIAVRCRTGKHQGYVDCAAFWFETKLYVNPGSRGFIAFDQHVMLS